MTTTTRTEFCKLHGLTSKQLTLLVATRRVALTDDGALVRVEESEQRLRQAAHDGPEAAAKLPRPVAVTRAEFAEIANFKANYTHQLQAEGRLVMAADGKHILVAESIARIAATRDPSKAAVAARHAANRGAEADTGHAPNASTARTDIAQAATNTVANDDADPDNTPTALYDFQNAKAKREHWAAEREHANYLKEAGELMERSAVVAAFADAGATLRAGLESWQVTLPPQLVGLDESAIRTTLADQVERLLHDLVDKLGRMAEQGSGA